MVANNIIVGDVGVHIRGDAWNGVTRESSLFHVEDLLAGDTLRVGTVQ